ncbi:MAG TPA: ATP-binding protein [Pyrinomonadaceae bacterium]|nr:ATP-binding protein [Pyrinomonadaceae bacterium]
MSADLPPKNHILIVDDEEPVRTLFAAALGETYECATAGNTQEALALLAAQPFELVITDVQMPGLNGIELLRKVLAEFPDTAVIVVSGVDRSQRVIDTLRLGASDYLLKPCEMDVLEMTVQRALERRALILEGKQNKEALERRNKELAGQKAELERLQAQVVQSEKMASLGQLAGGVAHELNNPAGFIYSNMDSLGDFADGLQRLLAVYDEIPLAPEFAARINQIKQSMGFENLLADMTSIINDCSEGARRIRDIVLNLRTFSRLDEAEVKMIDIHEGIDATIRLLSQYYGSSHIELKRDYGDLPPVECFAGQLNQVWMNLLVNAAQAIGQTPGEVRIETRLQDEMVVVSISDTGKGIEPDHMTRIFDPFFTTKPVGEGTGLGLSIIYGIIQKAGGKINVASNPGKGTTFTTHIPLKAQAQDAEPQVQEQLLN